MYLIQHDNYSNLFLRVSTLMLAVFNGMSYTREMSNFHTIPQMLICIK